MPPKDETPIQFKIPVAGSGVKKTGVLIPEPINQPHWVYQNPKPLSSAQEKVAIVLFFIWLIAIFVVSFFDPVPGTIALLMAGGATVLVGLYLLILTFIRDNEIQKSRQKLIGRKHKRKKYPKRRKDYR